MTAGPYVCPAVGAAVVRVGRPEINPLILAALSLIAQFLFLPYAPLWSVIVMALDVFVIWALASRQEAAAA
ncbi:hypothetical protein ABZ299_06270 [Streptomyces sp. NPDC006184]|uniref:DUF7144 family membrane protein n=1 Tax=Streptomyces sp. NPDC006184 TaxID=3155455 RepID=UPI0033AEBE96